MDGWPVGRLLTAAEFSGNFLRFRLAIVVRGDDPFLFMQIVPIPDIEVDEKSYARWSTRCRGPVPEDWGPRAGNPWLLCRYSGPLKTSTAAEVDQLIDDASGGRKNVDARIVGLIEAHLDGSSLALKDRRVLLQFLKKDFAAPAVDVLVRPEESGDGFALTLRAAQEIHRAVTAGERLTPAQVTQAEILLKYAPWSLGYWGPFKALVKAAPVDDLAEAYADAIARLSSAEDAVSVPAKVLIENPDELRGWFGLPTKRTRQYLARRVRRDLADLAKQSPDAFAQVASRMLMSWDESLSNYSYAPAFVLLGARSTLDDHSRYVRRPVDMAVRRDAHPEIWDERPEVVGKVFRSIRSSVEALTWACQVLDSGGPIPDIPARSIALALDSTYAPLRRMGCEALPGNPKIFESLKGNQWKAFFEHASESEVAFVADGLATKKLTRGLGEALASIFARPGERPEPHARLALLYLAAPKPFFTKHDTADTAAVVAAIEGSGLEHQSLWEPVVARMGPWALAEIYRTLASKESADAGLEVIATVLLAKKHHPADLILECLGSANPKVEELGWRLVEAHGGRTFLFTQLLSSAGPGDRIGPAIALPAVERMLMRANEPHEVAQVIRWALSIGIDQSVVTAIILDNPIGPAAVWEMIATETDGVPSGLATSSAEMTRLIGDGVTAPQLETAKAGQLKLVLRYITETPDRIARDAQFGAEAYKSTDAGLQAKALRQLQKSGQLPETWLTVAETQRAPGLEAARRYLNSLSDTALIREAVLACVRSEIAELRQIGIELFSSRDAISGDPAILANLGNSNDKLAQDLIAETAASGSPVDERVLQDFDRRILTDKKSSPRAKESVKKRLEASDASTGAESPDRVAALLELARGDLKRDREWALMRLATLALHGLRVEGLEVSLTTEGMVGLEDVAP